MATAADIIKLALKDIGVLGEAESASAYLVADGLTTLNQMLAEWQLTGVNIFAQQDITKVVTGAVSYTIGLADSDITAAPPARITAAFLRVSSIDYAIEILDTFEEYNSIIQKTLSGSYPEFLYYNADDPKGVIYLYPQPTVGTLHLITDVTFPVYATSADALSIPSAYELAVRFSLGELLAFTMGAQLSKRYTAQAAKSRRLIQRSNFKMGGLNGAGQKANIFTGDL